MIWSFDDFELDEPNYVLRRDGEPVAIRRRVFAVLQYLVARSGALVTKEELLANVWPDERTVEAVLPQNIAILRQLLGDDRGSHKYIQTVHGRGYRFSAAVTQRSHFTRLCVGREHVTTELCTQLDAARAGAGQCVVLQGDAGIGKTTLLEQLAAHARAGRALVLEAHAQNAAGTPAFWLWQQIAKSLSPELHMRLCEPARLATDDARFRLFSAVAAVIAEASRPRAVVLAFDDLHWADSDSIALLDFVARELRGCPVLVLGTTRPLQPEAADSSLSAWLASSHVRSLSLGGLTRTATAELARRVTGEAPEPELVAKVHESTEGNPLDIQQWARLVLYDMLSGTSGSGSQRLHDVLELRAKRLGTR